MCDFWQQLPTTCSKYVLFSIGTPQICISNLAHSAKQSTESLEGRNKHSAMRKKKYIFYNYQLWMNYFQILLLVWMNNHLPSWAQWLKAAYTCYLWLAQPLNFHLCFQPFYWQCTIFLSTILYKNSACWTKFLWR